MGRTSLLEAKVLIERWRQHYNTIRPHSALGYRPPAPEALQPCAVAMAAPPQPHRAGLLEGKTLTENRAFMGAGHTGVRMKSGSCVSLRQQDRSIASCHHDKHA